MTVPTHLQTFVDKLYAASDVGPSGHSAYVDLYVPDATLVMGPATYKGHDGIRAFREAGWEKIATRKHVCQGVYLDPTDPNGLMTYGVLDYGFKDGSKKEGIEWAGRLVLDGGKEPKIKFYQVYITSK